MNVACVAASDMHTCYGQVSNLKVWEKEHLHLDTYSELQQNIRISNVIMRNAEIDIGQVCWNWFVGVGIKDCWYSIVNKIELTPFVAKQTAWFLFRDVPE